MHGSCTRRAERQHPRAIESPPPTPPKRPSNATLLPPGRPPPLPLPNSIKLKSPPTIYRRLAERHTHGRATAAKWWRLQQLCPPCAKAAAAPPPLRRAGLPPRTSCANRTSASRAKRSHRFVLLFASSIRIDPSTPPSGSRTRRQGAGGDSRHSPWHDIASPPLSSRRRRKKTLPLARPQLALFGPENRRHSGAPSQSGSVRSKQGRCGG